MDIERGNIEILFQKIPICTCLRQRIALKVFWDTIKWMKDSI